MPGPEGYVPGIAREELAEVASGEDGIVSSLGDTDTPFFGASFDSVEEAAREIEGASEADEPPGQDSGTVTSSETREASKASTDQVPAIYSVDAVKQFLAREADHPLLSASEEVKLARRIERGDLAAKERLVCCNLRLVVDNAKPYQNKGLPFADLLQEGMLGLIRAVEKFDYRKEYRFSTYATDWIRQEIQRALRNQVRIIRYPVNVEEDLTKLESARKRLEQQGELSDKRLSEETRIPTDDIEDLRGLPVADVFLNKPIETADGVAGEVGDKLASDAPLPPDILVRDEEAAENRALLEARLTVLSPAEREAFALLVDRAGSLPDGTPIIHFRAVARVVGKPTKVVRAIFDRVIPEWAAKTDDSSVLVVDGDSHQEMERAILDFMQGKYGRRPKHASEFARQAKISDRHASRLYRQARGYETRTKKRYCNKEEITQLEKLLGEDETVRRHLDEIPAPDGRLIRGFLGFDGEKLSPDQLARERGTELQSVKPAYGRAMHRLAQAMKWAQAEEPPLY